MATTRGDGCHGWVRAAVVGMLLAAGAGLAGAQTTTQSERPTREQFAARLLERFPEADRDGDGQLSATEIRQFREQRGERRRLTPTHADLAYGDDVRHRVDLYLAESPTPTPLVVFFHGGGFIGGDKTRVPGRLVQALNAEGISVAAANYRFVTTDPLPAAMHDGARAIQFLRAHAADYHLDPERVGVTGGSAGAGISLWIAMHDDLADPESADPVARQSTRVSCASVTGAQVSYDPRFWVEIGLGNALSHREFPEMYGFEAQTPYDDPALAAAATESAPITHLTADDPPMQFYYGTPNVIDDQTPMSELIHHPRQGLTLQAAATPLGVPVTVYYRDDSPRPESAQVFFTRQLLGE